MADQSLNDFLITVGTAATQIIAGEPVTPIYQPGTGLVIQPTGYVQPTSLFNPSTWSLPMWLLIGGGVFLVVRSMSKPRRNPHRRRNPGFTHLRPSAAALRLYDEGRPRYPHLNPMPAAGVIMKNPRRRSAQHRRDIRHSKTQVRFHGAFALQADAERRAAKVGGWIKSFTVRGQRRYSVVTAA